MIGWPMIKQEVTEFFEDLRLQEPRLTNWDISFLPGGCMPDNQVGYCNREDMLLEIATDLHKTIRKCQEAGPPASHDFDLDECTEYKKLVLHEASHALENGFHDAAFWFKYEKMLDRHLDLILNEAELGDKSSSLAKLRAEEICDRLSPPD